MRGIKFRAWDKKNKRWIHHEESGQLFLNFETTGGGVFHLHDDLTMTGTDYYDILQYTGLMDAKGNEIFEGDIYEWLGYEVRNGKQIRPRRLFMVKWEIFELFKLNNLVENNMTVKVIGNIFENKDLLCSG